jgi:hypothetical protein
MQHQEWLSKSSSLFWRTWLGFFAELLREEDERDFSLDLMRVF